MHKNYFSHYWKLEVYITPFLEQIKTRQLTYCVWNSNNTTQSISLLMVPKGYCRTAGQTWCIFFWLAIAGGFGKYKQREADVKTKRRGPAVFPESCWPRLPSQNRLITSSVSLTPRLFTLRASQNRKSVFSWVCSSWAKAASRLTWVDFYKI